MIDTCTIENDEQILVCVVVHKADCNHVDDQVQFIFKEWLIVWNGKDVMNLSVALRSCTVGRI